MKLTTTKLPLYLCVICVAGTILNFLYIVMIQSSYYTKFNENMSQLKQMYSENIFYVS